MEDRQIGRLADVKALTKLSRPTIDRLERCGDFPARIRLGRAAVGWDLNEVRAWIEARPRGTKGSRSAVMATPRTA
jgi:prophage regulatory protein